MIQRLKKCIFDYDIDEQRYNVDYNDKILEQDYRAFLTDFLKKNTNLAKVKCVIINTRYTHRILENRFLINKLKPVVVLTDKVWDEENKNPPYIEDELIYELVSKLNDDGVCAFKDENPISIFDYIRKLGNAHYCGFCRISTIMDITWYKINDNIVAQVNMDTESG